MLKKVFKSFTKCLEDYIKSQDNHLTDVILYILDFHFMKIMLINDPDRYWIKVENTKNINEELDVS